MVTPNMVTAIYNINDLGVAYIKVGQKATTLLLPIVKSGCWSNNKKWSPNVQGLSKMCQ